MPKKITLCDGELQFNTGTELELYRVKTMFEKEPETIAWIDSWSEDRLDSEKVFFDIGANIGIFSLYASHKSKKTNIFSFEPVLDNYAALILNIKINNMSNISPFNFALSDQNKLSSLYINDLRVGNSGAQVDRSVNERQETFNAVRVENVISFSLDKLIDEFQFPLPNYVKIDVDGRETDILQGMIKALAHERLKSILIEFNDVKELSVWSNNLQKMGLKLDSTFDNVEGHSKFRRMKGNSTAMNCIFSKK